MLRLRTRRSAKNAPSQLQRSAAGAGPTRAELGGKVGSEAGGLQKGSSWQSLPKDGHGSSGREPAGGQQGRGGQERSKALCRLCKLAGKWGRCTLKGSFEKGGWETPLRQEIPGSIVLACLMRVLTSS